MWRQNKALAVWTITKKGQRRFRTSFVTGHACLPLLVSQQHTDGNLRLVPLVPPPSILYSQKKTNHTP